jgi:hypothetical protein
VGGGFLKKGCSHKNFLKFLCRQKLSWLLVAANYLLLGQATAVIKLSLVLT